MTENNTTGGDTETDIFSERIQLKPYEYADFLDYKDAIRNSYWVHTEFNFSGDVQDFKVNTTPAEKTVIKRTMLAIAQIEVQVKTFWADIYDEMPKAEVGNVGMTFAESEVRHMDAYSHLLDILGITEDFEEVTDVPAIEERIEYPVVETGRLNAYGTGTVHRYLEDILLRQLIREPRERASLPLTARGSRPHRQR